MLDNLILEINKSKQTILYVSHHRGFINQTASHVYEITKTSRKFQGDYNQYHSVKQLEFQSHKMHMISNKRNQKRWKNQLHA